MRLFKNDEDKIVQIKFELAEMNWNCGREPEKSRANTQSVRLSTLNRKESKLFCRVYLNWKHNIITISFAKPKVIHSLFRIKFFPRTQSVPSNDIFILLSPFRVFEQYWIKLFTPNMFVCFRQKDWLFISHFYPFIDKKNWAQKNEKTNYRRGIYDGGLKAFPTCWRNHERLRKPMNGAVEKKTCRNNNWVSLKVPDGVGC